jgi:hypothetical protein
VRIFSISLLSAAATGLIALSSPMAANAQGVDASAVVGGGHGDWTLKQREDWLVSRLDKARGDGSVDNHEYERVRHDLAGIRDDEDQLRGRHEGQLTDVETASLEARLDGVAGQIHWLHENSFQRPW